MENEGQNVEQTQQQQGISYEDAQALITQTAEEVAATYYQPEREADATYAADLQSLGDALSGDIKALSSGVDSLAASQDSKAGETVVVVLDSSQWSEIQKCWGWAKAGAQVGDNAKCVSLNRRSHASNGGNHIGHGVSTSHLPSSLPLTEKLNYEPDDVTQRPEHD